MRDAGEGLVRVATVRAESERTALMRIVSYAAELRKQIDMLGHALSRVAGSGETVGADLANALLFTDQIATEQAGLKGRVDELSAAARFQAAAYVEESRRREVLLTSFEARRKQAQRQREDMHREEAVETAAIRGGEEDLHGH